MKHFNTPFKILLLSLCACLLLGVGALAAEEESSEYTVFGYTDIAGTEYEDDITVMCAMGLGYGYADNTFRPGRLYTRVETAELVIGLLALEAPEDYVNPFHDTENIAGAEAVDAVVAHEFMSGRSGDSFAPYEGVLKAEFMSVLSKIALHLGTEDLTSRLDEDLALWAEDFRSVTAAEAMHAARAMIGALVLPEEAPSEEPAEETEESIEATADEAAEESTEDISAETAEEAETGIEDAAEEAPETVTEETAETEPAEDAEEEALTEPSGEPSGEASGEPSEEMTAPEAPSGVLAPEIPAATVVPTAAPAATAAPAVPTATAAPAAVETAPETDGFPAPPAATQIPEISPEDPGAEMKTTVYSFYKNIRDQLVSFFRDLLG